jgi:hypothetical protein
MEPSLLGAAVTHLDSNTDVLWRSLRVFNEDIEVAVSFKDTGIEKLVLRALTSAGAILSDKFLVGITSLRVLIQVPHVRVSRGAIKVKVVLLYVLTVVTLRRDEPKETLLQNRILLIPKRKGKNEELKTVTNSRQAILAPSVGFTSSVIVRKVIPGVPGCTIVLTHRSPGTLRHIWAPTFPVRIALAGVGESSMFLGRHTSP